ncbi:hypothetical protein PGT21_029190 [Puccinia graminis f. sp. tritici]|uniref:Uncharacterized protein n=1 Tax=Puccinia graminis f. sp. tritici TaxID=56615 RepID=A0A5B0N9M0_PUCGR|nr:hypothetical protein PGT21_029190 [Puccinia graminis f. sp. tritici]KAA1133032.1 hypothetical protein PGTUg99_024630 [Puccinia graminis f. sp. tritici]
MEAAERRICSSLQLPSYPHCSLSILQCAFGWLWIMCYDFAPPSTVFHASSLSQPVLAEGYSNLQPTTTPDRHRHHPSNFDILFNVNSSQSKPDPIQNYRHPTRLD